MKEKFPTPRGWVQAELDEFRDGGEVRVGCTLTAALGGAIYCGSLALCEDRGGIPFDEVRVARDPETSLLVEFPLSAGLLDEITAFAMENGY